ncbi:HAD family phosphatase [Candidatus Parcubacteria bacterium]|nr:HAD family phosphatase [Candidatus Parcubacteria bacterium]
MIKAITFDWGGVLIDNPASGLISYCANSLGVSEELFKDIFYEFEADFQRGIITEDVLWGAVCDKLNIKKSNSSSLWGDAFQYVYSPKAGMFSLASSLRNKNYKIGFLSNTEIPAMKYFHKQKYNMFDIMIFSCAEGVIKPESKIYKILLQRLEAKPRETIFIDDNMKYIEGAKKVGINTILFQDSSQVKKELLSFSVIIE